jgi:Tol biopolymer transport system component
MGLILLATNAAMSQFPVGEYDIYGVEVRTGRVFQFTSVPNAGEFNPSWSPDGKRVAHDVVGGPAPLGHSIFITEVKTGESTQLAGAEGGNDAAWSPNGAKIAFDLSRVGDPSIYVVPASGGAPALVRNDAVDPDWSPNSHRLVFQQPSDGSIRTVDQNGVRETLVAAAGATPVWSPNGQWIAFSNAGDIWKVRVNMFGFPLGTPQQVTTDPADDGQPSWSNKSQTIVFHSNRETGDYDIWIISAAGEPATRLTGLFDQGDFDPAFSNHGQFVAYAGLTGQISTKAGLTHELSVPSFFSLEQNHPNPLRASALNPETEIRFRIPEAAHVGLKVYNTLGQEIRTLAEAYYEAGHFSVRWDGKDKHGRAVPSGVYLYRLQAGSFRQVKKMYLLR